jgi:hypothetical protein
VGISRPRSVEGWRYPARQWTVGGALDPTPVLGPSMLGSAPGSSLRAIIAVASLAAEHWCKRDCDESKRCENDVGTSE